jgi:periplasmic mercuric ion binding protein
MKNFRIIVTALIAIMLSPAVMAQTSSKAPDSKTETIKVGGKCESCKDRIEKAAKMNGVSKADWNMDTHMLTVVYNPARVTSEAIQKSIAAAGHDTEKFKATDMAYNNLPACCKYR